ncbi:MAG: hypothetical protein WC724_01475 [Candidatus Paceibacterota bacterium]|jgi:hypothetical protein
MATEPFHQKLAEQIFSKMTADHVTSFDENVFYKDLYRLLQRNNAFDGKGYHGRKIKPLVMKMYEGYKVPLKAPTEAPVQESLDLFAT